jgi:imidazolonepropionase-like amidohydrolase
LKHILAAALLASAGAARAADPPRSFVLTAARIFDGRSETVSTPGRVVVTGGKIVGVGREAAAPPGAESIDLGEATLLPGFIDSHVHLTMDFKPEWYRGFYERQMLLPPEAALHAAVNARVTLLAGFTTVRDVGSDDFVAAGLRNAIRAGLAEGPRMLVSNHAISATGGHGDAPAFDPARVPSLGPLEGVCNGPEECRAAVRYQMKYGADVIKCMPSGGVLSLTDPLDAPELTLEEMRAIVSEAHAWGRKVAAHCHGDAAGKIAIEAGVDSIEHGSFLKPDTLARMKEKHVFLVPTLMAGEWTGGRAETLPPVLAVKARAALTARTEMFRNALRIGVPIAFGTDSAVSPHGRNAEEFALMVSLGMRPAAVLRAAGPAAAELLGIFDRAGTLEAGKAADVIAVAGNPLEDIRATEKVLFVMQEGRVVRRP